MRTRFVFLGLIGAVSFFGYAARAAAPPPASGKEFMVVTAQRDATEAGVAILEAGGNAIDAAVAVGYALAVTHPGAGNLGGGGFMTIHLADGRDTFINFRETAPGRATRDMFLDASGNVAPGRSTEGYLAVGVPGSPAGLDYALTKYGTMPRTRVIAPAIRLAAEGFVLTQGDADVLALSTEQFRAQPNVAAIFLKEGRTPFAVGDRLVQADLARTLALLAAEGPDAFYLGPIADKIVAASDANGGLLRKEDFIRYTVEELQPIRASYRGFDIVSAPPPSSGGVVACEILNVLSGYPLKDFGYHSAKTVHHMVEAMRHAYADRTALGDPNFVRNPVARLLSAERAAEIRAAIRPDRATRSEGLQPRPAPAAEGTQTTHYSVIDRWGNAVAVTYTINGYFGAHRIAGDTGFFLNNEMDDFTSKAGVPNTYGLIQGDSNTVAPGKRPLSSMTPTIVLKDGQPFLVVGSPGGSRIITTTLEVIVNVIDFNMNIQEAVNEPRVHHQWLPDVVYHEPRALSADTVAALETMGHRLTLQGPWSSAQSIEIPYADIQTGPPTPTGQGNVGNTLRRGVRYGGWDPRSTAGSARGR